MTIEDAALASAKQAAAILSERRPGFFGSIEFKYRADKIVTIEVKETIRRS